MRPTFVRPSKSIASSSRRPLSSSSTTKQTLVDLSSVSERVLDGDGVEAEFYEDRLGESIQAPSLERLATSAKMSLYEDNDKGDGKLPTSIHVRDTAKVIEEALEHLPHPVDLSDAEEEREWEEAQFKKGVSKTRTTLPTAFAASSVILKDVNALTIEANAEIDGLKAKIDQLLVELASFDTSVVSTADFDAITAELLTYFDWAEAVAIGVVTFTCTVPLERLLEHCRALSITDDALLIALIGPYASIHFSFYEKTELVPDLEEFLIRHSLPPSFTYPLIKSTLPTIAATARDPAALLNSVSSALSARAYEPLGPALRSTP